MLTSAESKLISISVKNIEFLSRVEPLWTPYARQTALNFHVVKVFG